MYLGIKSISSLAAINCIQIPPRKDDKMKSSKVYKEAFSKALSATIKELSKYNCNNVADTMLFSEYLVNCPSSKANGISRLISFKEQQKFFFERLFDKWLDTLLHYSF